MEDDTNGVAKTGKRLVCSEISNRKHKERIVFLCKLPKIKESLSDSLQERVYLYQVKTSLRKGWSEWSRRDGKRP